MAIDMEAAKAKLEKMKGERKSSSSSDVLWAKLPETGKLRFRILPPLDHEKLPGMVVRTHYNMPESEGVRNGAFKCFKTWGYECPVCSCIDSFGNLSDKERGELSGSYAYFNVLIYDSTEYEEDTVYVLKTSEFTYSWLLAQVVNSEVGDITDPDSGSTVTFKRDDKKSKWERTIARRQSPISDDAATYERIMNSRYDLSKIWPEPEDSAYNNATTLATKVQNLLDSRMTDLKKQAKKASDEPVNEVREAKQKRADEEEERKPKRPVNSYQSTVSEDEEEEPKGNAAKEERTPAPSAKTSIKRPTGAPDCFSDYTANQGKKCELCPYELDCQELSAE